MMMMMYCIACTLPLPTLPAVICWQWPHRRRQNGYHVECGWCWLLSDPYGIGCHNKKVSPNNNTIQYLQISPSTQ